MAMCRARAPAFARSANSLPLTCFEFQDGRRFELTRYWTPRYLPKLALDEREACDELLRLLREAVRLRMAADVPVGAFLSGGLDSSAVVLR